MSKLNNLRSGSTSAAIFSSNVEAPVASIFARMQGKTPPKSENKLTRRKYVPSRFRCSKGETKRLVIVDERFEFGMREHARQKPDGKWETVRCISDYDACPMCAVPNNRPYDLVLLTVLDLTPWEKDGKTYEYTKRVLALKKGDYERMQSVTSGRKMRGLVLDMERGYGDKESANGVPKYVDELSEDDMIEAFGSPEKTYDSGFVLPANNAIIAFDYKTIFEVPSVDELREHLGLAPRPGSKAEAKIDETPPWEEDTQTLDLNEELPDVD
jgi:hypothetical protein